MSNVRCFIFMNLCIMCPVRQNKNSRKRSWSRKRQLAISPVYTMNCIQDLCSICDVRGKSKSPDVVDPGEVAGQGSW